MSTSSVVPACVACNFKVYPFHRPVQNKCSELVADKRKYMQHRQRIAHVKSTVSCYHEDDIRRAKEKSCILPSFIDRDDVDHLIDDVILNINRLFRIYSQEDRPDYKPKSLNASKRKQELNRIIEENNSLYRRLINQKSCYPNKQLRKDWKYNQDLFTRISKYSHVRQNPVHTVRKSVILPPIQTKEVEMNTKYESKNLKASNDIENETDKFDAWHTLSVNM